jgi:hypothetical protein
MAPLSKPLAKRAFAVLHAAFLEEIPDILGQEGFVRSPFPSHHFGEDGPDRIYQFANLETPTTLEFLEIVVSKGLVLQVYFNAMTLDRPVTDLGIFSTSSGSVLVNPPVTLTRDSVHRWLPVPFLKIPLNYAVKSKKIKNEADIETVVAKPVTDLGNDLRYLDIIRAKWLEKHTRCTVSRDALLA